MLFILMTKVNKGLAFNTRRYWHFLEGFFTFLASHCIGSGREIMIIGINLSLIWSMVYDLWYTAIYWQGRNKVQYQYITFNYGLSWCYRYISTSTISEIWGECTILHIKWDNFQNLTIPVLSLSHVPGLRHLVFG